MKKSIYIMACLLFMGGQAAMAQRTSAQEVTPDLVAGRELIKKEVVTSYMAVKNSLIVSDSVKAAKGALEFIVALDQFRFKKLSLPDMNAATVLRKDIKALAVTISKTTNINQQRKAFSALSDKMWLMAAKVKPQEVTLYQQACPMTGDSWLSLEKDIKNPYFPKNMLTCGEVKQSI